MMIYDELIYVRILELQQYICMILLIATTWKPKYPLMSRNCLLSSHGCCGWQLKMYFFWTKSRILIKCKPIPAENHFFVHLLEIWKLLNALSARQRVCGPRRLLAAGNKGNLNPDKNYEISRPPQAASLIIILMVIGMVMAMVIGIMTTNSPTPYVAEPVSSV